MTEIDEAMRLMRKQPTPDEIGERLEKAHNVAQSLINGIDCEPKYIVLMCVLLPEETDEGHKAHYITNAKDLDAAAKELLGRIRRDEK